MFNISEFRSRLEKHGGPARTNLFVVEFSRTNLPTNISTDDLRFFCNTVSIPGINLELMQYVQGGTGYPEFMPMNASPDALNAVFLLDSNHRIMSFFHRWINSVVNVGGDAGISSTGLRRREINFKDEYTTSMTIRYYSANRTDQFYECKYDGVYPTQVGSMEMSWSSNDAPATLSVNFSYNRMFYSGFSDSTSSLNSGTEFSLGRSSNIQQFISSVDQRQIDGSVIGL